MHPLQDNYSVYSAARTLKLAGEIGAAVVRIDIHWGWIAYLGPSTVTWYAPQVQQLDAFLAEAARRHIQVLATVQDTPCWASKEPGKQCPPRGPEFRFNYPPSSPQLYATFLSQLVHHVGSKIQYYEIWNEPNLSHFWVSPDPIAYTRLLEAAYRAVKSQNPSAVVLAGATAGADSSFISRMYDSDARAYFDALSLHPYSGNRSPEVCSVPATSFRCGVEQIRQVMLRHGDTRPIWLTEMGTSVSSGSGPTFQARYVSKALTLVRGWSFVRGAIWYELYDDPTGHDGQHFGLFEKTLCPRPAASAFWKGVMPAKTAPALRCPQSL
jgi:hypothetical protein